MAGVLGMMLGRPGIPLASGHLRIAAMANIAELIELADPVVLLDAETEAGRALRGILMGHGVDVLIGHHLCDFESEPLVLINRSNYTEAGFRIKLNSLRASCPKAMVCVVSDESSHEIDRCAGC